MSEIEPGVILFISVVVTFILSIALYMLIKIQNKRINSWKNYLQTAIEIQNKRIDDLQKFMLDAIKIIGKKNEH